MVWFELSYHGIKRCDQLLHHQNSCHKTVCHGITYNVVQNLYIIYTWLLSRCLCFILTYSDGSLFWESISISTKSTILVISLLRVWLPLFKSGTWSVTLHTSLFLTVSTPVTLANGHWWCWQSCSFSITMSAISRFLLLSSHFVCFVNFTETLFYIYANTLQWYALQLLLEYKSGLMKTPGC